MMKRPAVALLIGLFAAIVVGAAGYFLLVGPKKASVDSKQKELESVENQITEQKNSFQQLSDIKNRSAEFEAKVAALKTRIPEHPELPALIRNIQTAADPVTGAGVPWVSFTPSEVTAGDGSFNTYDFTMGVAGFYSEITDFIYRLERMQRAILIRTINLAKATNILETTYSENLGLVSATIMARTFTFASPGGAPASPEPQQTAPATTPAEETESTPE